MRYQSYNDSESKCEMAVELFANSSLRCRQALPQFIVARTIEVGEWSRSNRSFLPVVKRKLPLALWVKTGFRSCLVEWRPANLQFAAATTT